MKLHRVVVTWAGPPVVGSAVTVLHYDGTNQTAPPVAAINTAFANMHNLLPNNVVVTVPNSGDSINDTDGTLAGSWVGTGGIANGGTGGAVGPAGVGGVVGWQTSTIVAGSKGPRRLRGRTFIVPLAGIAYDTSGTLTDAGLSVLNQFGTDLRASGPLAIWHRPLTKGATNGSSGPVISHRVRDKAAFLSSRRD